MARYRSRISGPLLDRIDLHVDVPSVDVGELRAASDEETSAVVRKRVSAARNRRARGAAPPLTADAELLLARASRHYALSARAIARCVGVARSIALLADHLTVGSMEISEALQFRIAAEDTGVQHNSAGEHPVRVAGRQA